MKLLQGIINACGLCLSSIVSLLPVSPFVKAMEYINLDNNVLAYINYFVPVAECLAVLELWGAAIVAFYIVKPIMLWIKSCN